MTPLLVDGPAAAPCTVLLGHGAGAHAPDEYWLIDSANPKVAGMDGAVRSYVDLFYALAT